MIPKCFGMRIKVPTAPDGTANAALAASALMTSPAAGYTLIEFGPSLQTKTTSAASKPATLGRIKPEAAAPCCTQAMLAFPIGVAVACVEPSGTYTKETSCWYAPQCWRASVV